MNYESMSPTEAHWRPRANDMAMGVDLTSKHLAFAQVNVNIASYDKNHTCRKWFTCSSGICRIMMAPSEQTNENLNLHFACRTLIPCLCTPGVYLNQMSLFMTRRRRWSDMNLFYCDLFRQLPLAYIPFRHPTSKILLLGLDHRHTCPCTVSGTNSGW